MNESRRYEDDRRRRTQDYGPSFAGPDEGTREQWRDQGDGRYASTRESWRDQGDGRYGDTDRRSESQSPQRYSDWDNRSYSRGGGDSRDYRGSDFRGGDYRGNDFRNRQDRDFRDMDSDRFGVDSFDADRFGSNGLGRDRFSADRWREDRGVFDPQGRRSGQWNSGGLDRGRSGQGQWNSGGTDQWNSGRSQWSGGGMGMNERGEFAGRGPKGYRRSDDRIREEVSDRLTDDDSIDASEIEITVKNGDVTLSGTVPDRQQKRRAEDVAESCSGVSDVTNNIRVAKADSASTSTQGRNTGNQASQTTQGSGSRRNAGSDAL